MHNQHLLLCWKSWLAPTWANRPSSALPSFLATRAYLSQVLRELKCQMGKVDQQELPVPKGPCRQCQRKKDRRRLEGRGKEKETRGSAHSQDLLFPSSKIYSLLQWARLQITLTPCCGVWGFKDHSADLRLVMNQLGRAVQITDTAAEQAWLQGLGKTPKPRFPHQRIRSIYFMELLC